jgi:hypothetical protein
MAEPSGVSVVEEDLSCFRCGYNLRSLQPEGVCPECGEEVKVSLPGRTLAVAEARWRQAQWQGARVQAVGLAIVEVSLLSLIFGAFRSKHGMLGVYLAFSGAFAASGIAILRMCRAESGGPYWDDAPWLRKLVRVASLVAAVGMVAYTALQLGETLWFYQPRDMVFWQNVLGVAGFGGGLIGDALLMWYFSRLAKRLPNRRLVIHGRWAAWSSVIVVGVIVGFGLAVTGMGISGPAWAMDCIGAALYSALFLWPAAYCLAWAHSVRKAGR